ncbi:MAG: hypothetical protein DCC65_07185 [Planctomycetota bacterium]|nr:MAG: hypothetical protein DCC65_07185 [Planctomycetota bacterium]
MPTDKGVVVSFRVDRHLARVLRKVPDKSSFIRDVILRSFYETCPVCRGRGILPAELSRWATRQLRASRADQCVCCLYGYPASTQRRRKRPEKRPRAFVCSHCRQHEHAH